MASEQGEEKARLATYTRRQFMEYRRVMNGAPCWVAKETVETAALEHPDWDLDEKMTWAEWSDSGEPPAPRESAPR